MENSFSLKDKTIIVTGASSGIGKACAILFSSLGANLTIVGRREEMLKETFQLLSPGKHLICAYDITDFSVIKTITEQAFENSGPINGFVHSAGAEITKPLKITEPQDYKTLFDINTIAAFEFVKQITKKKYLPEGGASYVFISALISDLIGRPALTAYGASKGALIGGMKSIALELSSKKIRVNAISPGFIETEMMGKLTENLSTSEIDKLKSNYPLGLGKPMDIAGASAFLLSDASRWVTGINLIIDGGFTAK